MNKFAIIDNFESITLSKLDRTPLMTRFDTKFIININNLNGLLSDLVSEYKILDINTKRMFEYNNLYFDTCNYNFYYDHHNEKYNRLKLRYREYVNSGTSFLEIKKKLSSFKTEKLRKPSEPIANHDISKHRYFIEGNSGLHSEDLKPVLQVKYSRITLLNKDNINKVTIDTGITFKNNIKSADLDNIAIIELKQEKLSRSDFERCVLNHNGVKLRISKYVIGTIFTHTHVKSNRFKEKILKLNKVNNGTFNY